MDFQAYTLSKYPEYACIQLKSPDVIQRPPVHLCVLLDTSGSMDEFSKLDYVKESLTFMLNFLAPTDKLSLVTFSQTAKTIIKGAPITPTEKGHIQTRISLITSESATNLSAGLISLNECLIQDPIYKQGILLLTDGQANAGMTEPDKIVGIVKALVGKYSGTSVSCVGYHTDHNAELLQAISSEGGGSYYVVNNQEDVATVFGDILGGLLSCVAQQVSISLPNTEVKTRYPTHLTGNTMTVMVGDMPANHEAVIIAQAPLGTNITVKGYDMTTYNMFEMNTVVTRTDSADLQTNGEAHYLRFTVLDILEKSKHIIEKLTRRDVCVTDHVVAEHVGVITDLIDRITEYKSTNAHSLWDVLLFELETCKEGLQNRHVHTFDTTQVMTQHMTFLGLMRGIPATPLTRDSDPSMQPQSLPSGFSNSVQRGISGQMQATVSNPRNHPCPALPPLPPSPQDESDELMDSRPPILSQIYDYTEDAEPCDPTESVAFPMPLPMPSPIARTLERC